MSKSVSTAFKQEKNKKENKPVVLFTLFNYNDSGDDLRLANYDQDIEFDSKTYQKYGISFSTIGENSRGQIDAVQISVLNVSRYIQTQLESYDLREKKVQIKIVWADQLADATNYLDYTYYVDSYSANQETAEFICTTKMDVIQKKVPGEIYLRTHCRYKKFKDANTCGYSGGETECNRTMQRCKELGNFQRFGGFPALPVRRLYVA